MTKKIISKEKKNIFKRHYYLFTTLFVIVLFSLLGFSYWLLGRAVEDVANQRTILNKYTLEELKIRELLEEHEMVEEQTDLLNEAVPDKGKLIEFIESIEAIGDILGINLTINMQEGVVDEEGVVVDVASDATKRITSYSGIGAVEALEVGITMRTTPGEFGKIINFIGMLEDLKYYSKIIDFKFNTGFDDNGNSYLDTILTLDLYVKSGKK